MSGIFFKTTNRSARQAWIFIGIGVIIAILSAVTSPYYYQWLLNRQNKVTLKIFCDTSELDQTQLDIFLLYDKVALHPISKAFGLFQLRPSEEATSFYIVKADNFSLTPYSITITNVSPHPLARIQLVSGSKRFYTIVKDRRVFNDTLKVIAGSSYFHPSLYLEKD